MDNILINSKQMKKISLTLLTVCYTLFLLTSGLTNSVYAQKKDVHVINGTTRIVAAQNIINKSEGITTPKLSGDAENTDIARYLGGVDTDRYVEYSIDVKKEGSYKLYPRGATPNTGWAFEVDIDDTKVASFTGKSTGGWGAWKTLEDLSQTINLKQGIHTLRLRFTQKKLNLNLLYFDYNGKIVK